MFAVAFSPDGSRVLTGGDGVVRVWEVATGRILTTFDHPGWVVAVAFSPDGSRALTGGDGVVRVWEVATGSEIARWHCDETPAHLAFAPHDPDQIMLGLRNGTVHSLQLRMP